MSARLSPEMATTHVPPRLGHRYTWQEVRSTPLPIEQGLALRHASTNTVPWKWPVSLGPFDKRSGCFPLKRKQLECKKSECLETSRLGESPSQPCEGIQYGEKQTSD